MAEEQKKSAATVVEAAETLVAFSVDPDDLERVLAMLPQAAEADRVAVEYELRLLKILAVGWALAYYLDQAPERAGLETAYWQGVEALAANVSQVAELTTGQKVPYFDTIKQRLADYVAALDGNDAADPTAAIGPRFARACGQPDNVHVVMAGNRVFRAGLEGVQRYLAAVRIS